MKSNQIDKSAFIKELSKWNKCYMKKPKSWQKVWFWWERLKHDPKEQWFMNIAKSTRTGVEQSSWITANDIDHMFNLMERDGYKYYKEE
jgi:hypothetical protein